jgi:hypothetical protein
MESIVVGLCVGFVLGAVFTIVLITVVRTR